MGLQQKKLQHLLPASCPPHKKSLPLAQTIPKLCRGEGGEPLYKFAGPSQDRCFAHSRFEKKVVTIITVKYVGKEYDSIRILSSVSWIGADAIFKYFSYLLSRGIEPFRIVV
jgi:hypothetical protein